MKITKRQLRRIIREGWMEDKRPSHVRSGNPRMSGMMDPEPQEVMDDIERRENMGLEEKVREWYYQEISDLAMLIHYEPDLSDEEILVALAEDPRFDVDSIEPEEMAMIWDLAELEAGEL